MTVARWLLAVMVLIPAARSQSAPAGIPRELARTRAERITAITYRLRFDLDATAATVQGFAQISFEFRPGAEDHGDLVLDFAGESITVRSINSRNPDQHLLVTKEHLVVPQAMLVAGINYIEASFTSRVSATGTPLTSYTDPTDGAVYLYTLLVPADAHGLFPCFDQPDLKATFRLTLTIPGDFVAIGNTDGDADPATDALADPSEAQALGRKVVAFRPTRPLSTYLFAFAAGPFAQIDDDVGAGIAPRPDRPLRMNLRRSQLRSVDLPKLFRLHRDALANLSRWFGIDYAFDKLEFVLVPGFPYGGMEHAGAIFYRESALVFDRTPTEPEEVRRSTLVYHEVAHQWFGNLVTMVWFDDLWLKEGFATFLAYSLLDQIEPARRSWLRFLQRVKMRAYAIDETDGTTPIWQDLDNLADAKSAYGAIVYNKAPAVLRELEARLEPERFRAAVQTFVRDHAFGNATWEDLVNALQTVGGLDDPAWSKRWILGKGLPVVRLEWSRDNDGKIDSCRLLQSGPDPLAAPWPIAVVVRVFWKDGSERDLRLRSSTRSVDIDELVGSPAPAAMLLNPADVAYGAFRLDPVSTAWFADHVESIEDPLTRVEVTTQLLQGTRDLELSPSDMADALLALIETERDPDTHEWLLGRLGVALGRQLIGSAHDRRAKIAERLVRAQLDEDRPGSKLALILFLATNCTDPGVQVLLRAVLDGKREIGGLELAARDRFVLAAALLAGGDAGAVDRESARDRESGDIARWAFIAGAANPDPKVKARYFADYLRIDGPPEQWVQDSLGNFHWPGQEALTLPYLEKALDRIEDVKRDRKIFFMPAWIDAFVNGHSSEAALTVVDAFLELHPDLDPDIRGKILQSVDDLRRTVRIRAKWH